MTATKKKTAEPKDFESALERLEAITDLLESGDAPLEESLDLYTEGLKIAKFCTGKLNDADKKIRLIADENGLMTETGFDSEDAE